MLTKKARSRKRAPKAAYRLSTTLSGKDEAGSFYVYAIYLPGNTPFLPTGNERRFLTSHPEIWIHQIKRFRDRDVLFVRVRRGRNFFGSHADKEMRTIRDAYLEYVATRGYAHKNISEYVLEACRAYLANRDYVSISWLPSQNNKGGSFTFTDVDGKEIASANVPGVKSDKDLHNLWRICKLYPAFTCEAAPP